MDTVFSTSGFVNKACMDCNALSMVAVASTETINACGTQLITSAERLHGSWHHIPQHHIPHKLSPKANYTARARQTEPQVHKRNSLFHTNSMRCNLKSNHTISDVLVILHHKRSMSHAHLCICHRLYPPPLRTVARSHL